MEVTGRNPLEATKLIRPMVDAHWASLRHAQETGGKTAWCAGMLFMLTKAMDIPTHFMAGYGSYCAGIKGHIPLLQAAEEDGHLGDTCSYHRLHMGLLALIRKGLPVREDVRLPVPDLCICTRACTEHSHYTDSIYRQFHIPVIPIDVPAVHKEADFEDAINYVERQLKEEAIPSIERVLGRPYNYDKLMEILAIHKDTCLLRDQCYELSRNVPAPWTLFDMCVSLAPVMYTTGTPQAKEYYVKLKAELEQRVANKVHPILPEEKYRIFWDNYMAWAWLGPMSRKTNSYGGNLVIGRYPAAMWPHPEEMVPEDPLHTLARAVTRWMVPIIVQEMWGLNFVSNCVEKYALDGLIMYSTRSCRLFSMGQQDVIDAIERKYGIPGVIIEGDMIDPKFWSESQIDLRLQAFFEMVETRKQARRYI